MSLPLFSDMFFTVKGTECGPDSKLSPHVLLGDLQETADKGAGDCGFDRYDINKFNACWIILRMKVKIMRLPSWREEFRIRTWSNGVEKFYFDREYEVFDKDDNVICQGSSVWILADMGTHRPLVPSRIKGFPEVKAQQDRLVFGQRCEKIRMLSRADIHEEPAIIKYADYSELDHNHHVNNTRYLAWTYDALHKKGVDVSNIDEITISYVSEVKSSEKVEVFVVEDDKKLCVYGFRNDDSPVFAAEIVLCIK